MAEIKAFCEECGVPVFDMTPRYKLKIMVSDGMDCAHLILFDSEVYALVNMSCRDLLSSNKVCIYASDIYVNLTS
ncbi:Nucleic acid-binding, OB-fold [Sesbania bispinosa]|nr:Nucleic acid-binding, OB-fold [Sesbania bispinosa]